MGNENDSEGKAKTLRWRPKLPGGYGAILAFSGSLTGPQRLSSEAVMSWKGW